MKVEDIKKLPYVLFVGSRALNVGTEESDYDFVCMSESADKIFKDLETVPEDLSSGYEGVDEETFGQGFVSNIKFTNEENKVINIFEFNDADTYRKYEKLHHIMSRLPLSCTFKKNKRVKHWAHIQYALGISEDIDIELDNDLYQVYHMLGKCLG